MTTCSELMRSAVSSDRVNLNKYHWLHPDGRRLISSWLDRAWEMRDCAIEDSFEPFIYTWISFNGWAACVTGIDTDRDWMNALVQSSRISDDFERLVADDQSALGGHAREFHALLPIFKAQAIRTRGVSRYQAKGRQGVIDHYLDSGIREFHPRCWLRHREEGSPIPLDWPHILPALYQVRCNLFHGEKAAHSEMDALIVASAFRTLINFLHETGYII